jgi:hypothetical protein
LFLAQELNVHLAIMLPIRRWTGQAVRTLFKADEKMSPKNRNSDENRPSEYTVGLLSRELLDGEEEDSEVDIDQPNGDSDRREG